MKIRGKINFVIWTEGELGILPEPPELPPELPPVELPPELPPIEGQPGGATITYGPGKCSHFGGPEDTGVTPDEGLALITSVSQAPDYFLPVQPPGTTGLARRLNPVTKYIACRWGYTQYGKDAEAGKQWLRTHKCSVTSKSGLRIESVQPVDWGPNEKTGRVSDLSPGLMKALGITTDDVVTVRMEAPGPAMPTVPSVGAPWLDVMKEITGTKEVPGSGDNQEILGWASYIAGKFPDMADYCALYKHDETAWCGLTVAYCMARCDIRPIFGATDTDKFLWANAWRQFGVAVDSPMPGDVLTFRWSNGSNHVALYDHETPGDQYAARGGNQSDAVNVTMFPMNACTSIRRPA